MILFSLPKRTRGIISRRILGNRLGEFPARGYKQRYVFPHSIYFLPKPGPDGFKLAYRICQNRDLSQLHQIVLFAEEPAVNEFPDELFFDDDLMWHQQQFGKKGHIATATLLTKDKNVYALAPHSDVVQRISRRREYKTRIEKVFKGWMHMLLNGVLNFAVEKRLSTVCIPTSQLALRNTDRARSPKPELFQRIYDEYVQQLFEVRKFEEWWMIDLDKNRHKVVCLDKISTSSNDKKTISLCHRITGMRTDRADLARFSEGVGCKNLMQMLALEKTFGVRTTYQVSGVVFNEVKDAITENGHCISFYSYDCLETNDQIPRCREIDYRIKGYCPFGDRISSEMNDTNLAFHNFEWIALSSRSLRKQKPVLTNGITRIPIHFDDSKLSEPGWDYSDWERNAMKTILRHNFVAFSLQDNYGSKWLSNYESFLEKLLNLGEIKTLDEVSIQTILNHST